MATKVEFHSSLASITNLVDLSDMTNEITSPRMHTNPLLDASSKSNDPSNSSNPLIVGKPNKFGIHFKPMTLVSELKPRLSPKPFSKEPSLEFLGIRKPIMTSKPQSLMKSSLQEKPEEQKQTSKEFHGSASLIQKNNGSENDSRTSVDQVASKNAFFLKPEPNKHLETTGITRSKSLRDNQGRKSDLKPTGSLHTKEWQLHNKFEVILKQSTVSKNTVEIHSDEALGSLKSRDFSLDSEMTHDKEKCILFTEKTASEVQMSAEVQPRRRRRPVSELFLGLPEDKKSNNLEYKELESQLSSVDKPLIRKPRPLSMDASSVCESKSCPQFVPILSENKEQIHVFSSSEIGSAGKPTKIVLKEENAFCGSVKAFAAVKLSTTDSKRKDKDKELKLTKPSLENVEKNNSPTSITKNRNYMSDHKYISSVKDEQEVKMALKDLAFEKIKDVKSGEDNVSKPTFLEQGKNVCVVDHENVTENLKNNGNIIPGGTVRNRIGRLFSVSNNPTVVSELQSGENESSGTNIQQRIKELAIENSDVKNVNARRSLPARPLSADLTKLFLGQGSGNERTYENVFEKKSALSVEVQPVKVGHAPDNQKNKDRAHSDASSLEGIRWKRHEFATVDENEKQLMKRGNISGQRRSASFRSKLTLSPSNSYEEPVKHTVSSESDSLKTVRATLFDQKVERHNAADALTVTDTVFVKSSNMAGIKPEVLDLSSHERTAEIKKELEAKMHLREEYYRQFDSSDIVHERLKFEKSVPCNIEKKTLTLDLPDKRTFDDYDKTPIYEENVDFQRVEPRYEIVQTIGERVLSESITVAVEDKAVILRSRKSSVTRKKSIKTDVDIPSQDMPLRFGNVDHQFKGDFPTSEAENRLESTKEKSVFASKHNAEGSTVFESSFLKTVDKQPEVVDALQEHFKDKLDIKSNKVNSGKSWISGYEINYSNDFVTDNHHRTELITMAKGESRVFGLKQYPESGKINTNINVMTKDYKEGNSQDPPMEGKARKHAGPISDLKMSERWRKKSAPQEVFDQFKEPESSLQSTSRQTDKSDPLFLQKLGTPNVKEMKPFVEANMASQRVSSSENNSNNSLDTMATCSAVTGQVRDFRNESSPGNHQKGIRKVGLGQDEPVYGISEDCAGKRKSMPPPSAAVFKLHYNNDVSSDKYPSEKLAKEENKDLSGSVMHDMPNKKTNLDDNNCRRRACNRSTGSMKENVIDANSFGKERKEKFCINAEENIAQYSDTHSHLAQKNTPNIVQNDPIENKNYAFKAEPADRYRSSVLDIDAIMADYIPGYSKVNRILDKQSKLMKEQKTPQKEKSKSLQVKNDTHSRNSKVQVATSLSGHSCKTYDETNTQVKIDMQSSENNLAVESSVADFHAAQKCRGTQLNVPAWDKKVGSDMFFSSHMEDGDKAISEWCDKGQDGFKRPCADVSKYEDPAAVILKSDPSWDCTAPRDATDHRAQESSVKHTFNTKSDDNNTVHIDRSSLVNTNRDPLMTLKHDLIKFKSRLSEYSDLKQSPADYKHRANARDSTAQQENEKRKVRHSLPPDKTENHVEKRRSFRHIRASSDLQKDTNNDRIGHSHRRLDLKDVTHVNNHKRSRSLHREREEDLQPDQLKQCFSRAKPAQKDTDTLVQEADSQYGTWSGEHQSQDSLSHGSPLSENVSSSRKPRASSSSSHLELDSQDATPDQRTASLDRSSIDMDSIDGIVLPPSVRSCPEEGELDFSFMDQPSVLDSSALKNRVQLSRRNHRRAPTLHTQRRSKSRLSDSQFAVIEESDSTWMFKDTTDEKSEKEEESEDEKEKTPKSTGQSQRLPVFPGMDPSVLKAQLRKRPESDGHTEASGSAHMYKSPKSSAQHGALGGRPLPSAAEKEDRTVEMSPQWLQELKSKKRLSQYENNT